MSDTQLFKAKYHGVPGTPTVTVLSRDPEAGTALVRSDEALPGHEELTVPLRELSSFTPVDLVEVMVRTRRYEIDHDRQTMPVLLLKEFLDGELASTMQRARFRFFYEAEQVAALLNGSLEADGRFQALPVSEEDA